MSYQTKPSQDFTAAETNGEINDFLNLLGTKNFNTPLLLGTYVLEDWKKENDYERVKLEKATKGYSNKQGSFAYVYVRNGKEIIYIGCTVGTTRIFTPSSIGGFNKFTREPKIPSAKHGMRNISTFFQVYDYLKQGDEISIYLIEAKSQTSIDNGNGVSFPVIVKHHAVEKYLLNMYKQRYGQMPPMHVMHEQAYAY